MLTGKLFTIALLFFIVMSAQAQTFEIRTVNEGFGTVGVQVRNTSDVPVTTSEFITDIKFGIKWKVSYNVDLAPVPSGNRYSLVKSSNRTVKDSFYFQAFGANNTPYQLPEDWTQNTWIEILSIANTLNSTDTGTFQICETGFDQTTDPNIGVNLSDYTPVINGEATGVILPVNLLSFTVAPANNTIKLNWSTSSETNSKGFDIQRSEDANQYTSIGFVNSKGKGTRTNYDFTDDQAIGGVKYFYRLKQVDINGNSRYSDIRDAMLDKIKEALLALSPNPAKEIINLQISRDCLTKSVTIQIVDSKGSSIDSWKEMIQAGKNIQKNISGLAGGQYFLIVKDENSILFSISFQKM